MARPFSVFLAFLLVLVYVASFKSAYFSKNARRGTCSTISMSNSGKIESVNTKSVIETDAEIVVDDSQVREDDEDNSSVDLKIISKVDAKLSRFKIHTTVKSSVIQEFFNMLVEDAKRKRPDFFNSGDKGVPDTATKDMHRFAIDYAIESIIMDTLEKKKLELTKSGTKSIVKRLQPSQLEAMVRPIEPKFVSYSELRDSFADGAFTDVTIDAFFTAMDSSPEAQAAYEAEVKAAAEEELAKQEKKKEIAMKKRSEKMAAMAEKKVEAMKAGAVPSGRRNREVNFGGQKVKI